MLKFIRKIKWLALICITQSIHTAYSQPVKFDQKFVDSITLRLPTYPDDTSKVNKLVLLARMYLTFEPTTAIKYAKAGDTIAEKIGYREGKIDCLSQSAFCFALIGEWVKATMNANDAIGLCQNDYPAKLLLLYNTMVINSFTKDDQEESLNWLQKALQNSAFLAGNEFTKYPTYMQLGITYIALGKLDSATYCANILFQYLKKYPNAIPGLSSDYYYLSGSIALGYKNYPEAIRYYHLASDNAQALSNVFHESNQTDSAIYYALICLKSGQAAKNNIAIRNSSKILAAEYAKSNPQESNKYFQLYIDARDTLYNVEKQKQLELIKLNEQKSVYELQKKETAVRNQYLLYSLFGILVSSVIFSFFIWRNNRFKQRVNEQLETAFKHLKSTQSQLIQSEKMASLGELTAGIAHEIQNPLNFVNNFSEVNNELVKEIKQELTIGTEQLVNGEIQRTISNLKNALEISNDIEANSEKINHHGKRAESIVKGMLEHSRKSSGIKEPTDINKLCDEFVRLSYHGLRAKDKDFNCEYKLDLDPNLPLVNVVSQDMGRVLLNILNNAFQACSEKSGSLKLESQKDNKPLVSISTKYVASLRRCELIISDNGPGIPDSIKDKIFQPFFTTKPAGQGTGLGLSLAYDIIKAHGGEINVKSEAGHGAEFIIQLPTL